MRYHNITKDDMLNGTGLRVVLWVAGCNHGCKGCHNPVTWNINGGLPFDEAAKEEIFEELRKPYIEGITFSGGDPLHPVNRKDVEDLITEIRIKFPDKNIWLYTGFSWEEVKYLPLVEKLDVLVDGRFIEALKDTKLYWRGSSNQKVINVKESLIRNAIVSIIQ
ncbi:anaerobic ribonucleoside-triphosphate reductase activating protein [Anaerocolumna xylanovorans]|uniref:Anaerobic ribonucleoside-triphosphate reductase-activating protein n=1 Tax=Anaerocolumna xylanovorans DSM 12503 TaxID=1121345 RepID=A0A1M7YK98_9FIRM|nr:anaerobic ribonucleoside-triphosphate reductase activating protein [Anaerocolumna xylanovorans]SHO53060.1 anaerobic ribonucleoside-triphosphate reductase activating protein [Anaerocolumna xylanovorans DSM 12503]